MAKSYYKVNIEITNICNLQCSFCPEVVRTKKQMDLDLFRRVLDQVAPRTRMVALHLMGDPLVHPRLAEMVEECAKRNVRIFFVTNGVLLREAEAELLLHPAFRQVSFSLHSFADNFGQKDPGVYLDRIFRFTEAALERRPELFINYRLWNLLTPQGETAENREILRRVEERFGVKVPPWNIREDKRVPIKDRLSLHFDEKFTWPELHLPVLSETGTCYGLTSHFGVLVDGTVVPCCLDKEGAIPLGNLRTQDLAEILGSPKAREMVAGFRNGQLLDPLCQRCQYVERFQPQAAARSPQTAVVS